MKFFSNSPYSKTFLSLLIGSFIISSTITFINLFFFKPNSPSSQITPEVLSAQSLPTPDPPQDFKTLNILLLGFGGAGHNGGFLTDVIQLAHFDFEKKLLAFISIPRDLWFQFPDGISRKVNSAFALNLNDSLTPHKDVQNDQAKNGAKEAKNTIATITNLPTNYFIAVDFVGFQKTIGYQLGNIEVDVLETLDDPWYPVKGLEQETCGKTPQEIADLTNKYSGFELEKQFPCRYEHIHFEKGLNIMEGGDALKFVRSRHGSTDGDFSRSLRQQAILLAIRNKLFSLNALENIPSFVKNIKKNIHTDIDKDLITLLTPHLINLKNFKTKSIVLNTNNTLTASRSNQGQFILIPKQGINNYQQIHQFIEKNLK